MRGIHAALVAGVLLSDMRGFHHHNVAIVPLFIQSTYISKRDGFAIVGMCHIIAYSDEQFCSS
jgi:hypothetical protein